MDPFLAEWGGLLLRWTHVIAAIAWIGSSFHFMHLDASLKPAPGIAPGKGGATWEVHGGGFYEVRKYLEAPPSLPPELIWHKWQSYATWASGFFLLVWMYYLQSEIYLIDPAVRELHPVVAALLGVAGLGAAWLVYDALCRSPLARSEAWLGVVLFGVVLVLTHAFAQVFSGRGALIHVGAAMATVMSANVFLVIIPGQKRIIADLVAGRTPDPALGRRAKIRSTHNNYITLPVVTLMLANHYALLTSSRHLPALVGLIVIAGALVRHFYNVRHAGKGDPWWTWVAAAIALWTAFWIASASAPLGRERLGLPPSAALAPAGPQAGAGPVTPAPPSAAPVRTAAATVPEAVVAIVGGRCAMCHAAEPNWPGVAIAPKGVHLDTPDAIRRQRDAIRVQSVLSHAMPPNNLTGLTPAERLRLAQWTGDAR